MQHTRSGLDWTKKFDEAKMLRVRSALLDGEATVMRPDGISDFGALQDDMSDGQSDVMSY